MNSTVAAHSLDSTFGCLFLAGTFSTALWGAGSIQLYLYYDRYMKTDKLWLRIYISVVYSLDTLHQIFIMAALYSYLVTNFSNSEHLMLNVRPLHSTSIVTALVDGLVQALFVRRAWHLSKKNYLLTGTLSLLVLGQTLSTIIYFGKSYNILKVADLGRVLPEERAMDIIVTIADLAIASVMAYLLHSCRPGMRQTDTLIDRLIFYSISTGLLTALASVLALVTAYVFPRSFIYVVFNLITPKLYVNSILAMLNSRAKLRKNVFLSAGSGRGLSGNSGNILFTTNGGLSTIATITYDTPGVIDIRADVHGRALTSGSGEQDEKEIWERKRYDGLGDDDDDASSEV